MLAGTRQEHAHACNAHRPATSRVHDGDGVGFTAPLLRWVRGVGRVCMESFPYENFQVKHVKGMSQNKLAVTWHTLAILDCVGTPVDGVRVCV